MCLSWSVGMAVKATDLWRVSCPPSVSHWEDTVVVELCCFSYGMSVQFSLLPSRLRARVGATSLAMIATKPHGGSPALYVSDSQLTSGLLSPFGVGPIA